MIPTASSRSSAAYYHGDTAEGLVQGGFLAAAQHGENVTEGVQNERWGSAEKVSKGNQGKRGKGVSIFLKIVRQAAIEKDFEFKKTWLLCSRSSWCSEWNPEGIQSISIDSTIGRISFLKPNLASP